MKTEYTKQEIEELEIEYSKMLTQRKKLNLSCITFKKIEPVKKLKRIKPVAKINEQGFIVNRYRSINQAAKKNKLSTQMIWFCCNDYKKKAKGFKWIFIN